MEARRLALLVATNRYQGDGGLLSELAAPGNDAKRLAAVLRDPEIAGFDQVDILNNKPRHLVEKSIGDFCADRGRDDLLLLYFTGHGVKDLSGRLHLATTDTKISN